MMIRKPLKPWIAVLTALLMLWGQFAMAAHNCPGAAASQAMHGASCHESGQDNGQDHNANLCKAHCEQSSQSAQTPTFDVPAVALIALWTLNDPLQIVQDTTFSPTAFQPQISASPPLRIQFQVFRI